MINDEDSKQQELQPWQSEQATKAGVQPDYVAKPTNANPSFAHPNMINAEIAHDSNCTKCRKKCGPIGWWFSPITDKLGYSLITTFYHAFNFGLALGIFIFMCVGVSVSVGLLILIVGFPLLWFVCEISVVLARFDLAMVYYMVEDDKRLIQHRIHKLKLSLYKKLAPCPCADGNSTLWSRIKSFFSCEMLLIIIYQVIFKPIITLLTCWICVVNVYFVAQLAVPIVYLAYPDIFSKQWCPYGGDSCNDDNSNCKCYGWAVNNFGDALLVCGATFLVIPLVFRVSQWFAKASKAVTYFFLTRFYFNDVDDRDHENLLIRSSQPSAPSAPISSNAPAIVHSVNNPYVNDV